MVNRMSGAHSIATDGKADWRSAPFIAGAIAALLAVLLIGEAIARIALPKDISIALGPDPRQPPIYKPDPQIGVDFRSFEDFRRHAEAPLNRLGPLDMSKRTWLMFGNSFVQGPGHLADTAQNALPDIRIFALRRQTELPLRAAEARLLLANGLRPERIFFVMFPIETLQVGRRPLSFIDVHPDGSMATRVRWPDEPWTPLVKTSRLATIAWIRSGRSAGDPSFDFRRVSGVPSPRVQDDLSRILDHLGETSRRFNVPVTIVAVPDRSQIFGQSGFGFQDTLAQLSRRAGLDFLDVRKPFIDATDKRALFVPDWHFNERGNKLFLQALLDYIKTTATRS
jgi:hypothetical protein